MQRRPTTPHLPRATKRPALPPKQTPRPALKPQPRVMNKQHRGGR